MKTLKSLVVTLTGTVLCFASQGAGDLPNDLTPISVQDAPTYGTYWSMAHWPDYPPCPMNCWGVGSDLYYSPSVGTNTIWVDDTVTTSGRMEAESFDYPPEPPGGGGGTNAPDPWLPDSTRNYVKFAPLVFSVLDTNTVAANDTNLYNVVASFPPDTNTYPTLQIQPYGNAVVIKANHFDYSAETRDFALLVCDSPAAPTWKNVDLSGSSDAQDGWLIEGSIPQYAVTDPMFMMVSNMTSVREAVFRAIPYGGPQVVLLGANDYDTVSNIITLQAAISDLSGTVTANQSMVVTVNGLAARYTSGPGNTISLDTHYAPNNGQEIEASFTSLPVAVDWQNLPMDAKLTYNTVATRYLDFENSAFVVNASDMCSPDIGINYIQFGLSQPDDIRVTIFDPASGRVLATNYASIPFAQTVSVPWNFTEIDGVTPYTNDTYVVQFVALDPTTLNVTNKIDPYGVRSGKGTIITMVQEDPSTPTGNYLNTAAENWIHQTLSFLYNDIYDQWGLTDYTQEAGWDYDVGYGRNLTTFSLDSFSPGTPNGWRAYMQQVLGSLLYSDLTLGPAHGNATSCGSYSGQFATTRDFLGWTSAAGNHWRMRFVAIWSCQSGANGLTNQFGVTNNAYPQFSGAFGIRPRAQQNSTFMWKNACLLWGKGIDQGWFSTTGNAQTTAEAEEAFDEFWVCGPNNYPGGCDPNYAIYTALSRLLRAYPLRPYGPILEGYYWLPYSETHDDELMGNVLTHVKQ